MRWVKQSTARARQLRRTETSEEKTLWRWLRGHRFRGLKWRRQHPVGPYFLDFACVGLKLAVELDGCGHLAKAAHDAERDRWLRAEGWTVLRFGNHDVVLRLHAVIETIYRASETVSPLPDPLP